MIELLWDYGRFDQPLHVECAIAMDVKATNGGIINNLAGRRMHYAVSTSGREVV